MNYNVIGVESCIFTLLATVVSLQQTKNFAFYPAFMKKIEYALISDATKGD